jgi:hypothetical protein
MSGEGELKKRICFNKVGVWAPVMTNKSDMPWYYTVIYKFNPKFKADKRKVDSVEVVLEEVKKDLYSCIGTKYVEYKRGKHLIYHDKPVKGAIKVENEANPYVILAKLQKWFGTPEGGE